MSAADALALLARAEASHRRSDWREAARSLGAALRALEAAKVEPAPSQRPAPAPRIAASAPPPERARSLIAFLAEAGIRDLSGELSARDLDRWHKAKPFRKRLCRPDGALTLEAAAERAWEAGFFPEAPPPRWDSADARCPVTDDMLIAAIEREAAGDFSRLFPDRSEDREGYADDDLSGDNWERVA